MPQLLTYPSARQAILEGRFHPPHDAVRLVLLDESYTPSEQHSSYSDVAAHEVSGPGYSARGKVIGQRVEHGNGESRLLSESVSWKPVEIEPRYGVLMLEDGTLLTCTDLGAGLYSNVEFKVPGGVVLVLK